MRLIETVEGGNVVYITSLAHSPSDETLTIKFAHLTNVDTLQDCGKLLFSTVKEYKQLITVEDDKSDLETGILCDDLLDIIERETNGRVHYLIVTTSREVAFATVCAPVWRLL